MENTAINKLVIEGNALRNTPILETFILLHSCPLVFWLQTCFYIISLNFASLNHWEYLLLLYISILYHFMSQSDNRVHIQPLPRRPSYPNVIGKSHTYNTQHVTTTLPHRCGCFWVASALLFCTPWLVVRCKLKGLWLLNDCMKCYIQPCKWHIWKSWLQTTSICIMYKQRWIAI